jgi:hypothetical protein
VLDRDPIVETLREKAALCLAGGPTTSRETIEYTRYSIAAAFEDAADLKTRDPAAASMLVSVCIVRMLHHVFRNANEFVPRAKDLLEAVRQRDSELASLVVAFYNTADLEERFDLGGRIADSTIGVRGFYEWSSEPKSD